MDAQHELIDIYRELYKELPEPAIKPNLIDLADRLSRLVKKQRPWGFEYLRNVINGKQEASKELQKAIAILIGGLDGQSPLQARLNPVPKLVYSVNGLQDGDIILGHTRRCQMESCGIRFVPVVPWQRYCCYEHTKKGQRGRR